MWHTKITRINWQNKFLFFIEDARVTFLSSPDLGHSHPPIWDSFHKVYFSGSSLSYLSGTRGQVTVQGVALWSITANCDRVLGINNQSMKTKLMLHITHYAVHGSNVWFISSLPPLKLTFIIGPESDHWLCLSVTDSLTHWLTHSLTHSHFSKKFKSS